MEDGKQKHTQNKEWVTPELKIITGFDVHENVATTYTIPKNGYSSNGDDLEGLK